MGRKAKENYFSIGMLFIGLIFYAFFACYDGAVICVDSPSYISMNISREPLYPIFLAILRFLFKAWGDFYLTAAAFVQSMLAAFAAWCLADYIRKELKLTRLAALLVLAMPLATSFLCRFAARRSSMYSNSILTEGIACSLFLIFFRYFLEFCYHQSAKSLISAGVLSFLLVATRKQMYLTVILLAVSIVFFSVKNRWKKGIIIFILCIGGIFVANKALDYGYNYILHETVTTHSSDERFLATMVFYASEREDADYIEDEKIRELFLQIYDICDEKGYVKHDAGEGWYNRVEHFGDYYDCIQIDTMWPMLESYVRDNYSGDSVFIENKVDELTQQIIKAVYPHVWPKIVLAFMDNFVEGLITTVAQRKPILVIYSVVAYMLYLVLLIRNIKKEGFNRLSVLGITVLLSIIINVAIVSSVIFCQSRYTIYNMPLFYIGLGLLVREEIAGKFQSTTF